MQKICQASGQTFTVSSQLQKFLAKHDLPLPTECPQQMWRRQMAWKNERSLYRRKCDATGKSIISVYSPDKPFKVYEPDFWWSDGWDPLSYGRDFDFTRPFFPQFDELYQAVPKLSLESLENENCNFTNLTNWNKDCYMIFEADQNQRAYYSCYLSQNKDCVDCFRTYESEKVYECKHCEWCYNSAFLDNCTRCRDSYFLQNCKECKNCFGCVNLKHKQYYWLNQPLEKTEYERRLASLDLSSCQNLISLKTNFEKHAQKFPNPAVYGRNIENSSGSHLRGVNNCQHSFYTEESEDCSYVIQAHQAKDCHCSNSPILGAEVVYNCYGAGAGASHLFSSWGVGRNSSNIFHSVWCINNCQNLLGCNGIRQKQNCILNKAYTKHEYEVLFERIKNHMKETGEWGQFFPLKIAPYAYNETVAQDWFPLTKKETLAQGLRWHEAEQKTVYQAEKLTPPDQLEDLTDDAWKHIYTCRECTANFRLIKPEIEFYRTQNLPAPDRCFECRQCEREAGSYLKELHDRRCDRCQKSVESIFAPEHESLVWCEDCYVNEALV